MNEQHARRPDGPWSEDWVDRSATPDHASPTEQFPTAQFPGGQFPGGLAPSDPSATAQFPPAERYEPQRYEPAQYEPERFANPNPPAQPYARPAEPLAHEGGFPYGMPPAAPYGPTAQFGPGAQFGAPAQFGYADPYIPQHLHVAPHQFPQGPYPPQFGYPPMQQTVYVNGGQVRRVNHALHLILTLLSFGLWLPVWIILAVANS